MNPENQLQQEIGETSDTIENQSVENKNTEEKKETEFFIKGKRIKSTSLGILEKKSWVSFRPGDTVKIHYIIKEGDKERIQIFEGTVIRIRGEDLNKTFTVRKISNGIGVERTFPYHSPWIANIELVKKGKVRRARLYYLRKKLGKAGRIKEVFQKQEESNPNNNQN